MLGGCFCELQERMVDYFTLCYVYVVICIFRVHSQIFGITGAHCSELLCYASCSIHKSGVEVNIFCLAVRPYCGLMTHFCRSSLSSIALIFSLGDFSTYGVSFYEQLKSWAVHIKGPVFGYL